MLTDNMVLRPFFKDRKGILLHLILLSFIVNVGALVQPFFFLMMSLNVIVTRDSTALYFLIALLVFVYAAIFVLDFVRHRILNRIAFLLEEHLSALIHKVMLHHTEINPGVVLTQPVGFLTKLRDFLTNGSTLSFLDLPFLPIYFITIFLLEPLFFWYALIMVTIVAMLTYLDHLLTHEKIKKSSEYNGLSLKALNGHLTSAEPVLVMGMKRYLYLQWLKLLFDALHMYNINTKIYARIAVISKVLRHLMPVGVMGVGAYIALHPNIMGEPVSIFVVMTASILISRIVIIADGVLSGWKGFYYAKDAFVNLKTLLLPFEAKEQHKITLSHPIITLKLDSAVYRASRTGALLINDVSFQATSGQVWAIMGGMGSGKTTLARLLLNVLPLSHGSLRYNDIESKLINQQALGHAIGYLPQEVELFSGTIAQNIARFQEPINHKSVAEAAALAGVSLWIERLPLGYETQIGNEDLLAISGGQRQQIALARAYYQNPSLLVLDEPNAHLDEMGEEMLNRALLFFQSKGSLVFVITHRPKVLSVTDHLLILNQGVMSYAGPKPSVSQV